MFSAFQVFKGELVDAWQYLQSKMGEKNLDCMPNSLFYNGTCIYISRKIEKLSWKHAERFCRKLPLNTSFATIDNEHKLEFLKREILKLREVEKPTDQLVFYIGFNYSRSMLKQLFELN